MSERASERGSEREMYMYPYSRTVKDVMVAEAAETGSRNGQAWERELWIYEYDE